MNDRFRSEEQRRAEENLVCGVIALGPSRGLMGDLLTACPRGSVKDPVYAEYWNAFADIHDAGKTVDYVTIFDALTERWRKGEREFQPDALTIAQMGQSCFATDSAVQHFASRLEGFRRCDAVQAALAEALAEISTAHADPDMVVQKAMRALEGVKEEVQHITLAPLMGAILEDVAAGGGAKPMPTPWRNLNAVLKGGAAPGELVVLAARPGMGKTALAGCWAVETARNYGPVLFVSCEVKDKTLGSRMLAREGRIDNRAFREGLGNSQSLFAEMAEAADRLADLPISIVDSSCRAVTPSQVRKWARKLGKPAMIVVDYLQLMYADEKHDSREREIADMSRSMKRLSVEMGCPVLLLSQLNRKAEEGNREPQLSDLRESGAIEQDADIVIMLHADKRDQSEKNVPMQALVRKGRSSGTGAADLLFEKQFSDFRVNDGYRPDFDRREAFDL
jgi:replicative DNA helicase